MCLVCGKAAPLGYVDSVWKIYKCDAARGCKQACIVCGYVEKCDRARESTQMWKCGKMIKPYCRE